MWQITTSITELMIRASVVFIFLFVVCRIWGRKHMGQLSPFDFILLLIISECFQSALQGEEKSITGGMVALLTLVTLNIFLTRSTYFSKRLEKVLDGTPEILIKDGVVNEELRKKQFMSYQDLYSALRLEGVIEIKDVLQATIETNGRITVIKKDS